MKNPGFAILFVLLLVAQILLSTYLNFSRFLFVTILPAMILCLPTDKGSISVMLLAFASGFAVDFFGDGILGLSSLALVPVALMRRGLIVVIFGSEVISRGESISIKRQGLPKMAFAIFVCNFVFLSIFILADGAGTQPLWFNLTKLVSSVALSTLVSFFVVDVFSASTDTLWK